jgi:hypothetical protein
LDRNNSELQFIEESHRDLVKNILNVSPQEEIKRLNIGSARRPRNWSIMHNKAAMETHAKKLILISYFASRFISLLEA